jgi:prepilin-type processing-associated H-X9-DG protein
MQQLPIPLPTDEHPSSIIHVNARAQIHQEGEVRALVVGGIPLLTWSADDDASDAYAMVLQVRGGFASPTEVAQAHGSTRMTVYRAQARFEEKGLPGLVRGKRGPKKARVLGDVAARRMVVLKRRGVSNGVIASKLGVTESGIRKALQRIGYPAPTPVQVELRSAAPEVAAATEARRPEAPVAEVEAHDIARSSMPPRVECAAQSTTSTAGCVPGESEVAPPTPTEAVHEAGAAASEPAAAGQAKAMTEGDPWDRTADRVCASMGLLSEAPPQFGDCKDVAGLGVLLALPALMATGVLDIAVKVYGRFGAAFFGVRSVFVCLALMALLRVKRAEHLRHRSPPMLGRLLGLDRAPEVKTLRRKVGQLARRGKSEEFQRELAQRRVAAHPEAMGFLYVDGHVRVYSGKVKLPKAHVTRMRLSMPATVDHWVNDREGEPLLVLTATPTASLAKEMMEIAREVRRLLGDRKVTIVFDRGGWSPKLFAVLIGELGFDILSYRKGRIPTVRKKSFSRREGNFDGRTVVYMLAERKLTLKYKGGKLALREVVRLSEDEEHQTSIVTSRKDLADVEVAYRMFERWRQENFFKYMGDEFEIDALWSYGTEAADPDREVPNPARKKPARTLREARAEVARLERVLGAAATLNEESKRPTRRGFKIANASVGKQLRKAHERVDKLHEELRRIPERVSARQAANGEPVVRLKTEAKRLTDTLKSVAYQAETALLRLIRPHYSRHEDEGRKLLASAMHLSGDIEVGTGELRITLEPAASPNRTRAIARLCDELNATQSFYPGTRLRLRYAIREA